MHSYRIRDSASTDITADCGKKKFNDSNIPHCCTSLSVQVVCTSSFI